MADPAIHESRTEAGVHPDGRPLSVVYLGLDDFPLGLAETQKVRLVSRGLIAEGCRVTLISRRWSAGKWRDTSGLAPAGTFEGIDYTNVCGCLYRPAGGWLHRKVVRVRGLLREPLAIARLRHAGRLDLAIVSTRTFSRVLQYWLYSRLLGFPVAVHVVENYSAMFRNATWNRRLNAWLFDRHVYRLVDGALPISRFLIDRLEKYAPGKPWLKDPGLVDLSRFEGLVRKGGKPYLLFCGHLGYMEVVRFILEAFELASTDPEVQLRMVVSGSDAEFDRFDRLRRTLRKAERVVTVSGITDRELSQLYLDAYALLIPLRPTDQDRARFPHKIGEYCGSGRPVITTAVGEVAERFTNGVNAFVAPRCETTAYARAIEAALADPAGADAIGAAGYKLAQEQFEYRRFGHAMKQFAERLASKAGNI